MTITVVRMSLKGLNVGPCVIDGSDAGIVYFWRVHRTKECANKPENQHMIWKILERCETQYMVQPTVFSNF